MCLYSTVQLGALEPMFLLSSAQQGSDPLFTFTTLLGTKPMTWYVYKISQMIIKQLGLAIVVTVLGEEAQVWAPDWYSW